jgi:hypothetical protein
MSVIQIRKAQREGARLVVMIAGVSGSGKTFTALELAHGLAGGDPEKVGFLDTENKRGSLYADKFPGFLIGDLYAPFSPQRYIDAVLEFQKAGVEVLVVDSFSHEWEGIGGCLEIRAQNRGPQGDKIAKEGHKRLMNVLLSCNMHIILCLRAREKVDFADPKNPVSLGIQPITEKNVMFEATASLMMWDEGKAQSVVKCPDALRTILGREKGYITRKDGEALRAWVGGAQQLDPELERHRNELRTVTQSGSEALRKAWAALPKDARTRLGAQFLEELKTSAAAFDGLNGGQRGETPGSVDRLNSEYPAGDNVVASPAGDTDEEDPL